MINKYNSKAHALTVTIIWGLTVVGSVILKIFDIDILGILISVSGVESIIATNYYVKAKAENVARTPIVNNEGSEL